jgi:hypothetical protein
MLIDYQSSKLSCELIEDEMISFRTVTMIENKRVLKVDSVGDKIRH